MSNIGKPEREFEVVPMPESTPIPEPPVFVPVEDPDKVPA